MSMRIMNNVAAQFAHRQLSNTSIRLDKSLEKLSSGYRINHSADDAAGLAVSEKLRTQIQGLAQSKRNIMDGISLLQTVEGGLDEVHSILQRMRVLSIQASNDTLTASDRSLIQTEVSQLLSEIDRMTSGVTFNTIKLFDLNSSIQKNTLTIHVGANSSQTLNITLSQITTTALSINQLTTNTADFNVSTTAAAESAIAILSNAINKVSSQRAMIGAMQNRLEHSYNFTGISYENQLSAESRIRDVDFADEMINFTKTQILAQAGNSMLAQANLQPQSVLRLLQ